MSLPTRRSKRPGAELERRVASALDGELTKNSGARNLDGDVLAESYAIECKHMESAGNYILKKDVLDKHIHDCAKRGLMPVWALQRADQPVVCAIMLSDFADMVRCMKYMTAEIRQLREEGIQQDE